jgi:hypothetical protein
MNAGVLTPRRFSFPPIALLALACLTLNAALLAPLSAQTNTYLDKFLHWPDETKLPPFPKPNPAQAFPAFKIYDSRNSPIRTPREDWEGAKALIAKDPTWQAWLAKTRQDVDDWMVNHPENIQWVTGWFHDFVSPKDGSMLKWTPAVPGKTLSSPTDPSVEVTPKIFGGWVFQFRTRHATMILEAARLYRLTGDVKYAEWSAAQLDFYADHFSNWPGQWFHPGCRIMWQSLDEAVDLIQYVNAARTLGDFVTPERKATWSAKLFEPDAALLQQTGYTIQNIPCWQRSAAAIVAMYCHDDALWKAAVEGPYGIRDQVNRGITSDYLWCEQSIGYNYYVVSALAPAFSYALMTGQGDALRPEMESVENLLFAPAMMRFPNGKCPNPADCTGPMSVPNEGVCAAVAGLFPNKVGVHQRASGKGWDALLDPPDAVPSGTFDLPPVTSLNMESSRMAVILGGRWQVYLHYGQLRADHAQAEALNFEAYLDKTDITHDPGTVPYGSALCNNYYRRGVCHNVPLVDGLDQEGWDPGKLDSFSTSSITASQPKYRHNARVSRTLTINGDHLDDSVTLTTTDNKTHTLGFVLNLQGKVRLPATFTSDHVFDGAQPEHGFQYWTDVRSATFTNEAAFDVDYQGVSLHVVFDLPGEFTITTGSAPNNSPTRRDALYIETQGQSATLNTHFLPAAPTPP